MQRIKLDSIDRKILAELQADGRMTNVELAKRVQISPPPCLRRVRALEEAGFIKGYHAQLDAKALGFEVGVFVMVGLSSQADTDLTRRLRKAGEMLDLPLLDHLIVSERGYFSFADEGML